MEEAGGFSIPVNDMVQPAQSCPSNHITGGFFEAASTAWAILMVNSSSESPRSAAVAAQYFRNSLLSIPQASTILGISFFFEFLHRHPPFMRKRQKTLLSEPLAKLL